MSFQNIVDYDGVWIDMNEVSNFCNPQGDGQVCTEDPTCSQPDGCCVICTTVNSTNKYDYPPFIPNIYYNSLGEKTLAQSSYHASGDVEFNAHSLYGMMESIATRKALLALKPNNRPFILSRSTFPGSGVHTAHWTGDNAATWDDLSASIITMNNMALFGIPMIGADICGFIGATTEELCTRWIEVGAFSPFSRDHNEYDAPPQELYRWESTTQASIIVLGLRYQLLPHLYTLMYEAHTLGRTVHNALWMHFPHDLTTHTETDGQYMWSGSILFTPVLTEGAVSVTGYFPAEVWYPLLDGDMIDASDGGRFVDLETPLLSTNVHLRGGHVIPMQQSAMTTAEVHASPFRLVVASPKLGNTVAGRLYLDDGTQNELTEYSIVNYHSDLYGSLTSTVVASSYSLSTAVLSSIEIWGGVDDSDVYCSATLTLTDSGVVVKPSSSVMEPVNGFNKVVITFDTKKSAVNIVSNYTVAYSCSDSKEKSSSDDDESGWDSLPLYGQALIIVGCCLVAVGLLGGSYLVHSRRKEESLDHPLL
jgi:alpha-D-xyloside xylohydrolase